jgi:hypothetical protein
MGTKLFEPGKIADIADDDACAHGRGLSPR